MIQQFLLFFHLILCVSLIGLVLIQHGKGADAGAAFGSGASTTVFGSAGSGSFLTRATTIVAILFAATCLTITLLSGSRSKEQTLTDRLLTEDVITEVPTISDIP